MGEGGSTPFSQGLLWAVNTDPPPCSKGPGATPASLGGGAQQLPVAEAGPAHTSAPPGQTVSQSLWSQSSGHVWGPGPCSPPSAPSPAPTALGPRSVPPHTPHLFDPLENLLVPRPFPPGTRPGRARAGEHVHQHEAGGAAPAGARRMLAWRGVPRRSRALDEREAAAAPLGPEVRLAPD